MKNINQAVPVNEVQIVSFNPSYKNDFKRLNEEWIRTYFEMEEADFKALDHPEEYIINKGGKILMALYHAEVIGTCALIKMNATDFELAKMAVQPNYQNLKIGWILGNEIIQLALSLGAQKLYLESNTKLVSAIKLYEKLGFKKIESSSSPYKRCNIQMELLLNQN